MKLEFSVQRPNSTSTHVKLFQVCTKDGGASANSAKQKRITDDLARNAKDKGDERQHALDAEIIPLNTNGPDGKLNHDARLNDILQELTKKVVVTEVGYGQGLCHGRGDAPERLQAGACDKDRTRSH